MSHIGTRINENPIHKHRDNFHGRKAPLKPLPRDRGERTETGGRSYMDRLIMAGKADAAIGWMLGEST